MLRLCTRSTVRQVAFGTSNNATQTVLRVLPATSVNRRWNSGSGGVVQDAVQLPSSVTSFLSENSVVHLAQDALCQFHDYMDVPWAPTIIAATLAVRLLVGTPITILQQRKIFRLEKLMPDIKKLAEDLQRETSIATKIYKLHPTQAQRSFRKSFKKHYNNLLEEHNCKPMSMVALTLLQLPVWVVLSSAIRNLAYRLPVSVAGDQEFRFMELLIESPAWIESLAQPDPFLLPAIFVGTTLANISLHRANNVAAAQQTTFRKAIPYVFGTITVAMGALGTVLPSAVTLYWATSASSALAVNTLLRLPGVGSKLGLSPKFSFSLFKRAPAKPKFA